MQKLKVSTKLKPNRDKNSMLSWCSKLMNVQRAFTKTWRKEVTAAEMLIPPVSP